MIVSLPGGARVEIGDNQTTYVMTDHLQSNRVATLKDNTTLEHINYTPFGDSQVTDGMKLYTGMNFEPETATYDFHARQYDPSLGRFTSPDAIRKSISPYSHTENNPINFLDPNGLGRISVLFYISRLTDDRSLQKIFNLRDRFQALGLETVDMNFSTVRSNSPYHKRLLSRGIVDHIIFDVGTEIVNQMQPDGTIRTIKVRPPADYAASQIQKMLAQRPDNPGSELDSIRSIYLQGHGLVQGPEEASSPWGGPSENSWAAKFAIEAKKRFPNLEKVTASPYNTSAETSHRNSIYTNIFVSTTGEGGREYKLRFKIPTMQYQDGSGLGRKFFITPTTELLQEFGVRSANEANPFIGKTPAEIGFSEPVLYHLPLVPSPPKQRSTTRAKVTIGATPHEVFEY